MFDGPTQITAENVAQIYQQAGKNGSLNIMMQIDQSPLCQHIPQSVRTSAIKLLLDVAPFPIVQQYLSEPFLGITDEMRAELVNYAVKQQIIIERGADLYLPIFNTKTRDQDQTSAAKSPDSTSKERKPSL